MFPLTYNALHSMQVQDALGESARDLALQQSNKAGSDQVSAAATCKGHTQTHADTHTQHAYTHKCTNVAVLTQSWLGSGQCCCYLQRSHTNTHIYAHKHTYTQT
jgi:hypothetical protein